MLVSLVSVSHALESSLLLDECLVGHGRKRSGLVHDRCVVDGLVNGVGVVDDGWLDSLPLDDGLDWTAS